MVLDLIDSGHYEARDLGINCDIAMDCVGLRMYKVRT